MEVDISGFGDSKWREMGKKGICFEFAQVPFSTFMVYKQLFRVGHSRLTLKFRSYFFILKKK